MKTKRIMVAILILCLAMSVFVPIKAFSAENTGEAQVRETWTINGKTIPRPGREAGTWYGQGECWAFAQEIYGYLWNGAYFTSYRGTDDDMLRNLTDAERRITADNTKAFLLQAAPGSVIRVMEYTYSHDGEVNGKYGHSMILISADSLGFTIYDDWDGYVRVRWFSYDGFASEMAYYVYFKYIKYPNASAFSPTPNALSISGAVYPTGNLNLGQYFDLYGIISSPNNIKSVTVGIYTNDDAETSEVKTYYPNSTSFNIHTQADADIKFNAITKAGYYRYKVTATNQTETKELINSQFTMGNPSRPEKPVLHISVNGSSVTVSWQSCSGATGYDVYFFEKNNENNRVHTKYGVTSTSYTTTLSNGDYMVHVASVNGNMTSCWAFSDWAYFTIFVQQPTPTPTQQPTPTPTQQPTPTPTQQPTPTPTQQPTPTPTTTPTATPTQQPITNLGDINHDGKINTADATVLLKVSAGMIFLADTERVIADVNRDNNINTADAVLILKYSAGMITTF